MTSNALELEASASLALEAPTEVASARRLAMSVRNFLQKHGLGRDELFAWELTISEAAKNAISFARPRGRNMAVRVSIEVSPMLVQAQVFDHTKGFDLERWPHCLPPNENENGRGIFLMRVYMDRINYVRGRGTNVLTLQRWRGHPHNNRPQ